MPAGGLAGAITIQSSMISVTDSVETWCGLEESVTVSVKGKLPKARGVPESCPAELSDIP